MPSRSTMSYSATSSRTFTGISSPDSPMTRPPARRCGRSSTTRSASHPTSFARESPTSKSISPSAEGQKTVNMAMSRRRRNHLRMFFLGAALCLVVSGCAIAEWIGVQLYYKNADLPEKQVLRDIPYWNSVDRHAARHRLDLFLPEGTQWPVLVFVHGGGWMEGDKSLRVGSADIYGNIGRFYASRGVGVAVINYELIPDVLWRHQLEDVARAAAWVHTHIAEYGGHASHLFLAGHSAGAQLVTRVALDPELLKATGFSPGIVCGVISVSGAALHRGGEYTYAQWGKLRNEHKRFWTLY